MHGRVAVIGAGSWGTALSLLLAGKGLDVRLWAHRREHVDNIRSQGENRAYLPGFPLAANILVTADIAEAVVDCPVVVMVVPSHGYRHVFRRLLPHLTPETVVVSAAKGIENESLMTMTMIMADEAGTQGCRTAVLSGPSFAKEVAGGKPTAVTVAATDVEIAAKVQQLFFTPMFRVYSSTDVVGVEMGGPLKNVIAIAAGISDGLDFGTNARAALITRGLAELTRLAVRMGARPLTMAGLAGLGDLVLTCTGDLSRNRSVGLKLGQGQTLALIMDEMRMVAEGVKTTRSARQLALRMGVEMPILEEVYQVLYEEKRCDEAVRSLMGRDQKQELEGV
ncbi:MAG: NAD(P)H-dependent glycerol-3-phosphate dehydrogenase [Thermodesulfobacteriota bacterium]